MKQTALLFFLLKIALCLQAQHVLTRQNNAPRAGDEIIKQQVEYKDPGRTGQHVLWDFSKLQVQNEHYILTYKQKNDSIIIGAEHETMYYYTLNNDKYLLWGYENPTNIIINKKPELQMKFPLTYGESCSGYYYGQGKYADKIQMVNMGTVSTKIDAFGMMVLPSLDTLRNVVRVYSTKTIAEDIQAIPFYTKKEKNTKKEFILTDDSIRYRIQNDTTLLVVETYKWYVKGYRYPIFETVKTITKHHGEALNFFDLAFFYPPIAHYYLESDPDNAALLESDENNSLPEDGNPQPGININPWEDFSYNFYPNPVENLLNIEYYITNPTTVNVGLFDIQGRPLNQQQEVHPQGGVYTKQVDMTGYTKGNYLLEITTQERTVSEVIIKK